MWSAGLKIFCILNRVCYETASQNSFYFRIDCFYAAHDACTVSAWLFKLINTRQSAEKLVMAQLFLRLTLLLVKM